MSPSIQQLNRPPLGGLAEGACYPAIPDLIFTWNDLTWPLVVTVDYKRLPVAVTVLAFYTEFLSPEYGVTYASYIITNVPLMIVFSLTARRFMEELEGGLGN